MATKFQHMCQNLLNKSELIGHELNGAICPTDTLPIIKMPFGLSRKRQLILEKRALKQRQAKLLKKQPVVIDSKCREKVFRLGQTYDKFSAVPLCSSGWKKRQSVGKHFTINRMFGNPAFEDISDEVTFELLGISSKLASILMQHNIKKPTSVQVEAIPELAMNRNALITAETGNGKTLAYLLPILEHIVKFREECEGTLTNRTSLSPIAVIIAPSRELAQQIASVCDLYGRPLGVSSCLMHGSTLSRTNNDAISANTNNRADILVATLGMFSKLLSKRVFSTDYIQHVVLDEVDTLFDSSFKDDIHNLFHRVRIRYEDTPGSGAQLVMVGATVPPEVEDSLVNVVNKDNIVTIKTEHLHKVLPHVTHRFFRLSTPKKVEKTLEIAAAAHMSKRPTLIFCNKATTVDWLGLTLLESGIECCHIGAQTAELTRRKMFERFMTGKTNVLTCTDLISRGLDTKHVEHVVNYNFPLYISDYIHRCGRVGRVGSKCNVPLVTNLIATPAEVELVQEIEYSVRRMIKLPNVNADIKRQYQERAQYVIEQAEKKENIREIRRLYRKSLKEDKL